MSENQSTVTVEIEGRQFETVAWYQDMTAMHALEKAYEASYNKIGDSTALNFALVNAGTGGYMLYMVNGTNDTPLALFDLSPSVWPFYAWVFFVNGTLSQNPFIGQFVLNAGDVLNLRYMSLQDIDAASQIQAKYAGLRRGAQG